MPNDIILLARDQFTDAPVYRKLAVIADKAIAELEGAEPSPQLTSLLAWLKAHEPETIGECPIPGCPGRIHRLGTPYKCDGRGHFFTEGRRTDA